MTAETIWQISQNHLNLFSTCPRKFQYTYLEKLSSPCVTQAQNHLNLGNRFHRLIQQRELSLPVDRLLASDQQLAQSFQALAEIAPEVVYPQEKTWREAEHRRTLLKEYFLLIGIYDLLILSAEKAQIIDWKTYAQPKDKTTLANNWQTRLYRYLLAETSTYLPEQIEFTYWFIKVPEKPRSISFSYSQVEHEATAEELDQLLMQLEVYYQNYQKKKVPFPQVEPERGYCWDCSFKVPCQRHLQSEAIRLSDIEEQPI
jgi:hypothetical protein